MNAELRAELKAEEAKRRLSEVIYFRRATSKLEVAYVYCCMAKVVTVYRLETEMKILERTSRRYLSQLEKLGLLGKKPTTYPTDRKRYFVIPNPDPETILSLKLIKSRNRDGRGSTLRVKKYKDDESNPQFRNPITTPGDLRREEEAKRRSEDAKRRDEEAKMREESREKERPERL